MSIEEFNPSIEIEEVHYAQINSDVIEKIDNIEAGFVWVYLRTKSKDWIVIKKHLQNKFHFGTNKCKEIFAYLKSHNLIAYKRKRRTDGTLDKVDIIVLNGSKFIENPTTGLEILPVDHTTDGSVDESDRLTTGSLYHPVVNQTCGFSRLPNINITNTKKVLTVAAQKEFKKEIQRENYTKSNLANVEKQSTSFGFVIETPEQADRRALLQLEEYKQMAQKRK